MSLDQLPYNVILQVLWYASPDKSDFGHLRATCKRLAEITRHQRFGHLVTCGNSRHKKANFDRISCLLLSQKGKNMTMVMSHYVRKCNFINVDILKFLVEHGANIHHCNDLMVRKAALKGELEAVKFLISCGANIHMESCDCVMNNAARSGNVELLKYLIDQGICVHKHRHIILHAVRCGNLEMVKFLVSIGFNIHERDCIISAAVASGNIELVRYLISQDIDVNEYQEYTLYRCANIGDIDMLKFLISCGADINIDNGSLIIPAAGTGNVEFAKYLIDQGINIHRHYKKALNQAVLKKKKDMVDFLTFVKSRKRKRMT